MEFFSNGWLSVMVVSICCSIGFFGAYLVSGNMDFPATVRNEPIANIAYRVSNGLAKAINVLHFMCIFAVFSGAAYAIYAIALI